MCFSKFYSFLFDCLFVFYYGERMFYVMLTDFPSLLAQIGRNPGLQAIWEDEKQRRREKCESSQIKTPDSQGKNKQKNKNCAAIFQNLWEWETRR